jgi:hypothetical protein
MWRSWRRASEQACSLRNRDDRASLDQLLGLQLLMLQQPQRRRYIDRRLVGTCNASRATLEIQINAILWR